MYDSTSSLLQSHFKGQEMALYIQTNPDHEGPLGARRVEQLITCTGKTKKRDVLHRLRCNGMVLDIFNCPDADDLQRFQGRLPSLSDTEENGT